MKKLIATVIAAAMLMSMLTIVSFAGQANTWGSSQVSRFDGNPNNEIAYRFATQGSGGLVAVIPYLGGTTTGSFTVTVYSWAGNYSDTVKGTAVASVEQTGFTEGTWTNRIEFPSPIPAGEYLVVFKVIQAGWAICNYVYSHNDGFKVYKDGVGSDESLYWLLEFEDGGWIKTNALSEDTEPTPSLDPVEPTKSVRTWNTTLGWAPGSLRHDGVGTKQFAFRVKTTGENGKLVSIAPYLAGEPGTFDCVVYAWDTNYATTVAGDPLVAVRNIEFDKTSWTNFSKNIYFGSGLSAGEYLIVITNYSGGWAVCNYRMGVVADYKYNISVYLEGEESLDADGNVYSAFWDLGFTGDGDVSKEVPEAPAVSELRLSYADADADDKIDAFYLNAVVKADVTDEVGIIFSDTEDSCVFGSALFSRTCTKYDALMQSKCYGETVITAENLGGEEGDKIISV
ncbi:MAG: hypothetical protein J5830_00615, partial [Clostridia bacterium]|nr:hypothetical protein [Clostridia bacterium]